ncbi:MAG TPA: intradiol ring-cleavage dioxygenase [Gaiellaceae bacterium]|jgi:protocatechuate 3,4-dioxygenase beta subunit|nr:intradiol ring-cleavage dioxygenase [Gaiellaceae bacterium]
MNRNEGLTRARLLRDAGVLGGALAVGGALGAGNALAELSVVAAGAAALSLTPEQEEGPYYVALEKIRREITLGRPGVPLKLRMTIVDSATGKPIRNAACDIWHCDASGVYSDESVEDTVGQTWLRGVQLTDARGVAAFDTIYPGHYVGRATHIHVKVHIGGTKTGTSYSGGHVSHTGQLMFDDAISTRVFALPPYASDTDVRTLDSGDRVYTEQGGKRSVLKLTKLGTSVADGYLGTITLSVDPAATPAVVGAAGP